MSARAGQASSASPMLAARYRVEAALGRGGAAKVFAVTDTARGEQVALKLLDPGAPPHVLEMFELEYRTLAGLRHPRVVSVFDYGFDEGCPFYTMELLRGEDLKERAPVRWREACGYLRDAAQALGLLHARGLLHRDVSPRNLWRTPNGRVTLLDFGALARFGSSKHIVGTPPFVPPEVLGNRELDQRADLYALGAVGYYLLTGLHAYPARDMRDLAELWKSPPVPVSQRVAELRRADMDGVPPAVDGLIASLLSLEPLARPSGTDELIDRLDAVLGATRPSREEQAQLRLSNSAFVGRRRERGQLRRLLRLADGGRGQTCRIEAEPGMGRSRLLRELALEAQVLPAVVAKIDGASHAAPYGTAEALAWQLLDALPELARRCAEPYAWTLAYLSPRLRARLGVAASALAGPSPDLRVRIQSELRDWFLSIAAQRTLVVLVDDVEHVDLGSAAFLLALAQVCRGARLLLVLVTWRDLGRDPTLTERAFAEASRRLVMGPLERAETVQLLGSIFGDAEHLDRLSDRLHRASGGNPGHLLALTEELVRRNAIGFVSGTWVLPRALSDDLLISSKQQAASARFELLTPGARTLARVLAVAGEPITMDVGRVLADGVTEGLFLHLTDLLERGIAARDGDRLWVKSDAHRGMLRDELQPAARKQLERALGEALLAQAGDDPLQRLKASLHLLQGGDARGLDVAAPAGLHLALRDEVRIIASLPALEACLACFELARRPDRERITLLAPLAMSGYFADLRYAVQYGDQALSVLQDFVGLTLARKLQPVLGAERGMKAALAIAAARARHYRNNPRVPTMQEAMALLFSCVATLIGTCNLCSDPEGASRRAAVLEPFSALGPASFPAFMYEFCVALSQTTRDQASRSALALQRVLDRMEQTQVLAALPEPLRRRYLGGALFSLGSLQSIRDGDLALRTAERLEALGARRFVMHADQVRTAYYANQGDYVRFESARKRVEQHAIQLGTTGLAETWTLSMLMGFCLRTRDTITMKRVSEQLQRMHDDVPMVAAFAKRARAGYLLLRGEFAAALPIFEQDLADQDGRRMGYRRLHGLIARIHNQLGQHDKARAMCLRVHADRGDEEALFPSLSLLQRTELVIAEAALGEVAQATQRLDALIALHLPLRGPLTMGQLHETGLELARITRNPVALQHHLHELERWYLPTGTPSLVQLCQSLRDRIVKREGPPAAVALRASRASQPESGRDLAVARQIAGGALSVAERARKALDILITQAHATDGCLYVLDDASVPQRAALRGAAPSDLLLSWIHERLDEEREDEVTQLDGAAMTVPRHLDTREIEGRSHRMFVLRAWDTPAQSLVGVAVLGGTEAAPAACPREVLGTIAQVLQSARLRDAGE